MRYCIFLLLTFPLFSRAQKLPSIEEKTGNTKKLDGYFPFYWEEPAGKIWLEINKTETEFLYVVSLTSGLGSNDVGLDRGLIGAQKLVKFNRVGRKLLLVQPNQYYRAVSNDAAEVRAVENSFAQSVIWGFNIEAESNGRVLVDATDFVVRDAMQAVNQLRNLRQGNFTVDKSRSAPYLPNTKNFPLNTEFEATVTLANADGQPGQFVQSVAPTADAVTLRIHQSFVQLPDNNFKKREYDPRAGYFAFSYYDYATPVYERLQKVFLPRHRLERKDKTAPFSEAVKPIVYYLDNGTPEPIRSALLEGASWWNQAFEAAGYRNAFQVKILPDSADPWDIRYNMINWVHRSTRGWSYGASIIDPRTGEIIKGQVTLGSLRVRQDYLIAEGLLAPYANGQRPADDKMLQMALARMRQLAAHEVGHTLGLAHNYAASARNRSSVMDYPSPAVTLNARGEVDLSNAYATGIGEWDKISITYGYADFPAGVDEKMILSKLLETSNKNGLMFISDVDARSPAGIHPTAHLWDNGANAVAELKNTLQVRQKALEQFGENNIRSGTPMAFLELSLVPIYLYHRYQLEAVTKQIGGMNYTYAIRGDGQVITEPLPRKDQLSALNAVIDAIDPKVLMLPEKITRLIPPLNFSGELFKRRTGLAFDVLTPAETAADLPFSFLLNVPRINRLAETAEMPDQLGLTEMLNTLVNATWKAPRRTGVERLIQMQTEQILLTYLLAASVSDNTSFVAKASVIKALADLKTFAESRSKTATGDYAGHLLLAIDRMKAPDKAKPTLHIEIPPGAPIGCDVD